MNLSFIATPRNRVYTYLVYWFFYFIFFWLIESSFQFDYMGVFLAEITGLPVKVIFVTIVLEFLSSAFLFKKKYVAFACIYIVLLFIFSFAQRIVDNFIIIDYINPTWEKQSIFWSPAFVYNLIKFTFVAAIPFNIKLFAHWVNEQKIAQQNAAEKMQAELNFLRNQFHPHFIFNVLNSLYSKILSQSKDAGDIVLKISSLLRFTIYDISNKSVSLKKEITYIEDYISLQRTRFDTRIDVSFICNGIIEEKTIEPFLIIPFVENSFKYCINKDSETGWVTIFISMSEGWLIAKIENSLPGVYAPPDAAGNINFKSSGVGLENVKKRLNLLYPSTHSLKITNGPDSFFVLLKVKI